MFDRLKAIDWQSLNASKLPDWIIGLTSPDKDIYFRSYGKLQEYLCHYVEHPREYEPLLSTDAPVVAAPFFIELLGHPQARKASILHILEILGRYHFVEGLKAPFSVRANQIHEILLSHFDSYIPYLDSANANERTDVMYLLGRFEEKSSYVIDQFLIRIEHQLEPDELCKQVTAENIFRNIQKSVSIAETFSNRFIKVMQLWVSNPQEPLAVRATAANYLLQLFGDKVEQEVVEVMVYALTPPNSDDYGVFELEYINTLMQYGGKYAIDALLRVFEAQIDYGLIFETAAMLFILAFSSRKMESVHVSSFPALNPNDKAIITLYPFNSVPLNDEQRKILRHIIAKEQIWEVGTNFFDMFALPNSRAELRTLTTQNST